MTLYSRGFEFETVIVYLKQVHQETFTKSNLCAIFYYGYCVLN